MHGVGLTPDEALEAAKKALETPVRGSELAPVSESVEKLIRLATIFLSLKDAGLREVLLAEAQNRVMIAAAVLKKPWEMGT